MMRVGEGKRKERAVGLFEEVREKALRRLKTVGNRAISYL